MDRSEFARQSGRRSAVFPLAVVLLLGLLVAVLVAGAAQSTQPPARDGNKPIILPATNRFPDANAQMAMHEQTTKKQNFEAANAERQRQIADDSARLLKLATELKAEVDKTNKDMLSVTVVRKADEIERLARGVKEKMKLTMGN